MDVPNLVGAGSEGSPRNPRLSRRNPALVQDYASYPLPRGKVSALQVSPVQLQVHSAQKPCTTSRAPAQYQPYASRMTSYLSLPRTLSV